MTTVLEHSLTLNTPVPAGRIPRLLLVAYNFPPVGGAGVQRPVKWVKNLRRLGWDVTVLTTENPSVPTRDESLLSDIPDDVVVVRAKTWEPDYQTKRGLVEQRSSTATGIVARAKSAAKGIARQGVKLLLQPDPQILWVPNAIRAGRRILSQSSHDVILVTAPAYSSFFIGTALKRRFGLPLVLDFRDEWDLSGKYLENAQSDMVSRIIQERMQRHLLKRADAVVATTIASTAKLAEKLSRLKRAATRTATVYNGFDNEDFASQIRSDHETEAEPKAKQNAKKTFRLLYTGTLWNLTTIKPLVDGIQKLNEKSPELISQLELVCVGRKTPEQTSILERLKETTCRLQLIDYCEHSKVLDWLRSTDAVCLLLSDVAGAERVVPAKLFEYLANRKDMLAIVPGGETADIVRRFFPLGHVDPKNIDGIAEWLRGRLSGESGMETLISPSADINEYSRTTQTKRLVELLNQLVPSLSPSGRVIP